MEYQVDRVLRWFGLVRVGASVRAGDELCRCLEGHLSQYSEGFRAADWRAVKDWRRLRG